MIGTTSYDSGNSIFLDNNNYIYFFDNTTGNLNNVLNNGNDDVFIIKTQSF